MNRIRKNPCKKRLTRLKKYNAFLVEGACCLLVMAFQFSSKCLPGDYGLSGILDEEGTNGWMAKARVK